MNDQELATAAAATSPKEQLKALKEELKAAKKNHKTAVTYNKSVAEDAEGKDEARAAENGWAAEVARLESEVEARTAEAKAAAEAEKIAKAEAKARNSTPKIVQNGQTKPKEGTTSDRLWNLFAAAEERLGRTPAIGDVFDEAVGQGFQPGTTKAAYGHWRKFNGVTGRVKSEEQLRKEREAEEAKAAKEAARQAAEQAKAAADAQQPEPAPATE